ncbi:MAG: peptidylprolyl isomerase [Pirellulales bacterium]|nr:peptidylprolyl isomerase [Pirellulales bacterium]
MAYPLSKRARRLSRVPFVRDGRSKQPSSFRRTRLETLEPRWTLSASPTLAPIADLTLLAGSPLHVPLDGSDADSDVLTFAATSDNSNVTLELADSNRSMRIHVESADGTINGDMVFELFEDLAPDVTARIIELAQSGFYDDVLFHRIIDGFMIQTGGYDDTGYVATDVDTFDDQFHPYLQHNGTGILSMAKTDYDDTNSSQFFILDTPDWTDADADYPRYLDFNHSVFGQMTEGFDILEAISQADTGTDTEPDVAITMKSVVIFTDTENDVLRLKAAEGYTGEADITVVVSDGDGNETQQVFHVTVEADTTNNNPYLDPISTVELDAGGTATFTLSSIDIEGDAVYYAGTVSPESDDIQMSVDNDTGVVTITASDTAGGVYGIFVGVSNTAYSAWDTQAIPVLVTPAAPTSVELVASSDTGASNTDDLTYLNNTTDQALWFRVNGVVDGATVSIYADGELIGQTIATSESPIVITDGTHELLDGTHSITAVQGFYGDAVDIGNSEEVATLVSEASAALVITVDATAPVITSEEITETNGGVPYVYDVESDAETAGEAYYSLSLAPSGMLIDSQTGQITWTPTPSHGPDQAVEVVVKDAAGNQTTHAFEIDINRAPEALPIGNKQVEESSLLMFEILADDPDSTSDIITVIEFGLEPGAPEGAAITETAPNAAQFTWIPTEAQGPGTYTITVRTTDPDGAVGFHHFTVTVTEKNEAPAVDPIDDAEVDEGVLLQFDVTATDPDLPANTFTFSLAAGSPAGAAIDAQTGRFTWEPGEQYGDGEYSITAIVTDSAGATGQRAFVVAVNEVDNGPEFEPAATQVATPGFAFRLKAQASDPDTIDNAIRYELEPGAPEGVTINPVSGLIAWDVPLDQPAGSIYLTVRATEVLPGGGPGLSTVATLEVQVGEFPSRAFDQALSLSGNAPVLELQTVREAVDSLLFGSVRTIRFMPAPIAASQREPILGFQIGVHGGGTGVIPSEESGKDATDKPGDETNPADQDNQPKSEERASLDGDVSTDIDSASDSTELAALAPAEMLDAALEEIAQEASRTAVDQVIAAR